MYCCAVRGGISRPPARAPPARACRCAWPDRVHVLRRDRLAKLGEDVTETLERVPARWFVIQHVREKFSRRGCETAVTFSLTPLVARIEAHVRAAQRIHVNDTPVPVLANGKIRPGHLWTVVRDDRPFAGCHSPA